MARLYRKLRKHIYWENGAYFVTIENKKTTITASDDNEAIRIGKAYIYPVLKERFQKRVRALQERYDKTLAALKKRYEVEFY